MRLLVKFGYLGWAFRGSQRQPHGETVEDALLSALRRIEAIDDADQARFSVASRTDAGVSARGNAFAIDTEMDPAELVSGLAGVLDDVHPWGWCEVPDGFDPRQARARWYRYHLFNRGYDAAAVRQAASVFEGQRDFSAFAKTDPSRDVETDRYLDSFDVTFQESFLVFDVEAPSFLWQQIRRMVGALIRVGEGEITAADIEEMLATGKADEVRVAPPEGLVLVDVDLGLDVETVRAARDRIRQAVLDGVADHLTRTQVLKDLAR